MGMWGQSLLKTENHPAITFLSLFFEVGRFLHKEEL